ncbi:MAG: cytochrome c maturation protein CcmE [Planctomycetes bacterium]|nr:cytochrome c maturation protein CcmE [Planctomycetota bacterium]
MRLFIIGAIFILAAGALVTVGIISRGIPVLMVKDLFAAEPTFRPEDTIRVDNGKIVAIDSLAPRLRFKYATEKEPGNVIQVESDRNPPENFRVGIGASIKGTYDREKKFFKAYQVSTNCPSRYDPKEELKKSAEQQQGAPGSPPSYEAPPRSTSRAVPRGIRTDGSDVVGR